MREHVCTNYMLEREFSVSFDQFKYATHKRQPYMGKERFCGTDTTKSLLIYQRTEPCLDKECLEVSPDSQHNSGIVILVGKVFLLNQSMHRLNRFLCSAFIQAICQFILGEGPVYSVAYQQDLVAGQQGNRILIPLY